MAEKLRYMREPFIQSFASFESFENKDVLEIGVGTGIDFMQFMRHHANATGIDISLKSLEICKRRLSTRGIKPEVVLADAENLPIVDNHFDLVYSYGVIHHSPAPEKVVSEIYRVMKPGAKIKAMVYHRHSLVSLRKMMWEIVLKRRIRNSLDEVLSESLESRGTRAYSLAGVRWLFSKFKELTAHPILTYYDVGFVPPKFLQQFASRIGFFIMVTGVKPSQTMGKEEEA